MSNTMKKPCTGDACQANGHALYVHLPIAGRYTARGLHDTDASVGLVMSPQDALACLARVIAGAGGRSIAMVALCGPGDPLATPDDTLATLRLIRQAYPELPVCIGVNGPGGAAVAEDLAAIGLDHVTLYVNAVDPDIVARLYRWIRPGKRTLPIKSAAEALVQEQRAALLAFKAAGLAVQVDVMVFPGINDAHVPDIARTVAALGADCLKLVPCAPIPAMASDSEECPEQLAPGEELLERLRAEARVWLPVTTEPDACSAGGDVALWQESGPGTNGVGFLDGLPRPDATRPNVAVASSDGVRVDEHLGRAQRFLIYGPRDGLVCLLDARPGPLPGGGDERWETLAQALSDCKLVLVEQAGQNPERILARRGLRLVRLSGEIESIVDALYGGGKKARGCNIQRTE